MRSDNLLEVPVLRTGAERLPVIGAIQGKMWTGVITYRGRRCAHHLRAAFAQERGRTL